MTHLRIVLAVACFAVTLTMSKDVRSEEPARTAIARAHAFLGKESEGNFILGYMHLGAKYKGHEI